MACTIKKVKLNTSEQDKSIFKKQPRLPEHNDGVDVSLEFLTFRKEHYTFIHDLAKWKCIGSRTALKDFAPF